MPRVDLGNGYLADFPDEMSKADVQVALRKQFGDPRPSDNPGLINKPASDNPGLINKPASDNPPVGSAAPPAESAPSSGQSTPSALSDAADTAYSAISGIGQGAFGVGDYAGAAGQLLGAQIRGEKITPQEAYDRAKALREGSQGRHPIAAAVGDVAGAIATAPAAAGAIRQIPGVARALAPVAGQTVRNVARVAAEGGAVSAATAAAGGQDPLQAGAEGAVISPVAAKAAQLGLAAGKKVVGLVSSAQAQSNAMESLAKRIGSTPAELRSAMDAFRTATGRPPTLAEIVDSGSAAELGKIADARKVAGDQFNRSAEQITQQRPANMQAQIESRGPTDTLSNLSSVRENAMNAAMGRVGNIVVHVPPRDVDHFLDPDAARVLSRDLRARLSQAQISGRPAQLTVRDIDNMRIAFNDAADTGQRHVFYDLANRVGQIGATQVPSYGSALSEYSAFSRGIKGFEHGTKGTTPAELKSAGDIADAQSPEYNAGRNVGVRSRVAQAAGASERGAVSTANDLRQNAGTATELRGALGERETSGLRQHTITTPTTSTTVTNNIRDPNNLQAQGQAETQSARNLALTAPGAQAASDETARDIGDAIKSGIAAGGHASATYKAGVLARLVSNAKLSVMSRDTARRIAEASTDPARLPGVIDALRRARLNEQQIREIFVPRAGVVVGTLVGEQEQ